VTLRRTSHSVYDRADHLIWCPEYRKGIFERAEIRERAGKMIQEICGAYDVEILEMEVMEEHVHLLVSFPPSRSIGEVVRIIKSQSRRGTFRRAPTLTV
jgi:putative transposase